MHRIKIGFGALRSVYYFTGSLDDPVGVRDKGGRVAHPQHEPRHALSGGGPIQLCSFLTLRSL